MAKTRSNPVQQKTQALDAKAPPSQTTQVTTQVADRKGSIKAQVLVGVVAGLLLLVATFAYWARNNIYNTQRFTDQITTAVQDEQTRQAIGAEVAGELYTNRPIAGRLLTKPTESLISSLLTNDKFSGILDTMATRLNERLVHGRNNAVVVDISGFAPTINSIAESLAPDADVQLPTGDAARIVLLKPDTIPNLQPAGRVILAIAPLALLALIVLTIISFIKARSKLTFFKVAGIVLLSVGAILQLILSTATAQLSLQAQNANQATILESVYTQFTDSLQSYTLGLIWAGILLLLGVIVIHYRQNIKQFAVSSWQKLPKNRDKK